MKVMRETKNFNRKRAMSQTQAPAPDTRSSTQTAAEKARAAGDSQSRSKTVTIEAKVDVGFGNTLFLRGEGQGLSWNQGIPLTCVGGAMWKWSGETTDALKFKLLLNDAVWAKGEDLIVAPGQRIEVAPAF